MTPEPRDSSAASICETCGHPWSMHTSGGMCAGGSPDGSECYCVLFPPDRDSSAASDRDAQRIRDLEAALTQAIQVIEWCGLNDKTPTYNYGEPRRNGDVPGAARTFNTPREFASWWPSRLRVALDGEL